MNGPEILFYIPILGGLPVTETLVNSWLVMALLVLLSLWLTHGMRKRGISKKQVVVETGVKMLFADEELAARLGSLGVKLSSANSINIGRLVPQVAYYVYSYVKMVENGALKDGEPMNIVVPTGNFGTLTGT